MTRSSDFPQLLPSCPSSQAPPRPAHAFPGLPSWALGVGGWGIASCIRASEPWLDSCSPPSWLGALGKVAQPL